MNTITQAPLVVQRHVLVAASGEPALAGQVERIAARQPELAGRAQRAAAIVITGAVTLTPGAFEIHHSGVRTDHVAQVRSQNGGGTYDVVAVHGQLFCNCPDGVSSAPRSKVAEHTCKHIIAYLLSA
jgi:hypothetical protein